jgi:hypothetical protein
MVIRSQYCEKVQTRDHRNCDGDVSHRVATKKQTARIYAGCIMRVKKSMDLLNCRRAFGKEIYHVRLKDAGDAALVVDYAMRIGASGPRMAIRLFVNTACAVRAR